MLNNNHQTTHTTTGPLSSSASPSSSSRSRKHTAHSAEWSGYSDLRREAKHVGHLVLDAMGKKGLTFVTLYGMLRGTYRWNVHNDAIYALIRGKKFPYVHEMACLANALDIDPVPLIEAYVLDSVEVQKYRPPVAELFDFYHWLRLMDNKPPGKRRKIALAAMEKEFNNVGVAKEFAELLYLYDVFQSIPEQLRPLFYAQVETLSRLAREEQEKNDEPQTDIQPSGEECRTY